MRFDHITTLSIDQLDLDVGNYRFRKADDQRECIEKIHRTSPPAFTDMLRSIANDELGEPLLVYVDENDNNIVMDGNRRAAAVKVLQDPHLAPTETLRHRARELKATTDFDFDNIVVQVSRDKPLILNTIRERHSAGGGVSRMKWPALARARFGYDNNPQAEADWKIIALLYRLEELNPSLTDYFDSSEYKHDVFRRILPVAIEKGVISQNIFSERNRNVKRSQTALVNDARRKCSRIFNDIKNGTIGLSRAEGIYADRDGVEAYLDRFPLSRDNQQRQTESEPTDDTQQEDTDTEQQNDQTPSTEDTGSQAEPQTTTTPTPSTGRGNITIIPSASVDAAIRASGSTKLRELYDSICTVSLNMHPSLVTMGAWAFLESLANRIGKHDNVSIDSFFNKRKMREWWPGTPYSNRVNDSFRALVYIREEANAVKHSARYHTLNAHNLIGHFQCLEHLILKALELPEEN